MAENTNLQKWTEYTAEQARKEKEDCARQAGTSDYFTPADGRNIMRFLPGVHGNGPFRITHQHFFRLPNTDKPVVFTCPRLEAKRFCPACKIVDALKRTGNRADRDKAYEMRASRKVYANIIDRKNPEMGVQAYSFGAMVHDQLIAIRDNDDMGGADFTNPDNGFDICVTKTKEKNGIKYKVLASRNNSPLGSKEQVDAYLEQAFDVNQFVEVQAPDEIEARMRGDDMKEFYKQRREAQSAAGDNAPAAQEPSKASRSAADAIEDAEFEEVKSVDERNF